MKTGAIAALAMAGAFAACASASPLPRNSQTVLSTQESKSLAVVRPDSSGLERFWHRRGIALGMIKWDGAKSRVLPPAPAELLRALRDEAGRLNQTERTGEDVWLTINVYNWTTPLFGKAPRASIEVVGRDRAGQVVWLGQGRVPGDASFADSLADTPEQIVARETLKRLRRELNL